MKKEYLKSMINWLVFTVIFGIFPILFLVVSCLFTGNSINITTMAKETFFFTIVLCADSLRTYNNSKNKNSKVGETSLYGFAIIVLILSSVLYGGLLIYGEEDYTISIISVIFAITSFIIDMFMQHCVTVQIIMQSQKTPSPWEK